VEGGFNGRTNKLVDGCYSFWQGGVFPILQQVMQQELHQQVGLGWIGGLMGTCLDINSSWQQAARVDGVRALCVCGGGGVPVGSLCLWRGGGGHTFANLQGLCVCGLRQGI